MRLTKQFTGRDAAALLFSLLLLSNLAAVGGSGRERAKRAVCLANLRELTLAWISYADDNDGNIVNGDPGEYGPREDEPSWVLLDWRVGMTTLQRQTAIRDGALFPYTQDVRLYRCPSDEPSRTRSYVVVDSMNCKEWPPGILIKNRSEVEQPDARLVFMDFGDPIVCMGGWTCNVQEERWWDPPPIRHRDGTDFSFADGHAEHWMWEDSRTVEWGLRMMSLSPEQPGNKDLGRMQTAVWGTVFDTGRSPER
ncbi:MAG: hypothetical protein ABFE13_18510 [Phycisphaerales bacterium]